MMGQHCEVRARKLFPTTLTFRYRCLNDDVASHLPQTSWFASSLNLLHTGSQPARGQSPPYLWIDKFFNFKALRLFRFGSFRSEDKLRLRPNRGSGKAMAGDFSTKSKISCGGQWTSQRFIAFDREELAQ